MFYYRMRLSASVYTHTLCYQHLLVLMKILTGGNDCISQYNFNSYFFQYACKLQESTKF